MCDYVCEGIDLGKMLFVRKERRKKKEKRRRHPKTKKTGWRRDSICVTLHSQIPGNFVSSFLFLSVRKADPVVCVAPALRSVEVPSLFFSSLRSRCRRNRNTGSAMWLSLSTRIVSLLLHAWETGARTLVRLVDYAEPLVRSSSFGTRACSHVKHDGTISTRDRMEGGEFFHVPWIPGGIGGRRIHSLAAQERRDWCFILVSTLVCIGGEVSSLRVLLISRFREGIRPHS